MTCRDCVYSKVCPKAKHIENYHLTSGCSDFKNKEDFVEVVRCKNCKYWQNEVFDSVFEHSFGECHCPQWDNDYFYYETADIDFCSYRKRKEN